MRNADRRGCGDRGMLIEHFVDFAWINILAAANNHVALAIDDEEESILVPITNIAGMKPAVAKGLLSSFGILEITFQNVVAAQNDFSKFPVRNVIIVVVNNFHFISNRQTT